MRTVEVIFENEDYNYKTSINGTDQEIKNYFVGKSFNLGSVGDNMQKCISCNLDPP